MSDAMIVYSAYMVSSAYMRAAYRVEDVRNDYAVKAAHRLLWGLEHEARVAALQMERHEELWKVCLQRSGQWTACRPQAWA